MPKQTRTQTFNDGICQICEVHNIAAPGEMPKDGIAEKAKLRYEERTVGMSRFWAAMQAQSKIHLLLRMPQIRSVNDYDVVVLRDGEQYVIKQIQYPKDVEPPSMDLSLERLDTKYVFGGDGV